MTNYSRLTSPNAIVVGCCHYKMLLFNMQVKNGKIYIYIQERTQMMMEMEGERGYEILLVMFLLLKIRKPMNMGTPYIHDSYISIRIMQ